MTTFSDYKSIPAINATAIKAGVASMKAMRHIMEGGEKPATSAMEWGSLVHAAILEPGAFFKDVAIWEGGARKGKAWEAFKAEHTGGPIITKDEQAELFAVSNAVHANPDAHRLIEQTRHEAVFEWERDCYGKAKARLDGCCADYFIELKTTSKLHDFGRQFVNMGYDIGAGWYQEAMEQANANRTPCYLIAVESAPPWDCAVWTAPPFAVTKGRDKAVAIATQYRECERNGVFPGIATGISELVLPAWYEAGTSIELVFGDEKMEV